MKTRIFAVCALIAVLALFPIAVSGEPLETADTNARSNPLTFVEVDFDLGMRGARAVAISPGNKHVYVASAQEDAVSVFSRDETSGVLSLVEIERDGVAGVDGLNGAVSIVVSPDGNHVYVAASAGAVAVFDRNTSTGAITFVERQANGEGGVDGLGGARSVALDPDGDHVYVAGRGDEAIAIFSRSAITGGLKYEGKVQNGSGGVSGLFGVNAVTVSPDKVHVYTTSDGDNAVVVFSRDLGTGMLTYRSKVVDGSGGVDGLNDAVSVVVSPDGDHVYVAGEGDDAVAIFNRDAGTGGLSYEGQMKDGEGGVDGLDGANSLAVSSDGDYVYATGGDDNALAVFSRNGFSGALTFVEMEQDGVGGVDGLVGAGAVAVTSDRSHVYATSFYDHGVVGFSQNETSGALGFVGAWLSANGLEGAVGVAVSPDGKHVYVTGYSDDAVACFERNPATGTLTWQYAYVDGSEFLDYLDGVIGVALDPGGENVYVTSSDDDSLTVFSRNASDGSLTFQEVFTDGVSNGLDGARAIAVSPDGERVYVASSADDAMAIFDRNLADGTLVWRGWAEDGEFGVDGLDGAYSIVVSPDGKHIYVAGYDDDAVAHFEYDIAVVYQADDLWKDGTGMANYLDGANGLAISPDGKHVYVASRHDDSVTVFARLPVSGNLNWVADYRDSVGGVDGLNGARAVAVSADGSQVYVAGQYDHALAVFDRDATTGALQFVGMHKDGIDGVDGLNTADGLAVSPEGGHVYVTGYGDDAVATFARFKVYLPLVVRNY